MSSLFTSKVSTSQRGIHCDKAMQLPAPNWEAGWWMGFPTPCCLRCFNKLSIFGFTSLGDGHHDPSVLAA
eukprot:s177_g13.t1